MKKSPATCKWPCVQVCARLGLTSLAYLWHQPQAQLLQDMIQAGIHAILVKVAAMGLDPHKHLGCTLAQIQPIMHRLNRCRQSPALLACAGATLLCCCLCAGCGSCPGCLQGCNCWGTRGGPVQARQWGGVAGIAYSP